MTEINFKAMREAMVNSQLRVNGVNDAAILAAFLETPREHYVPPRQAALAYCDESLPLTPTRALTSPLLFGRLLTAAHIARGEKILIIGAGLGYSSAICAALGARVTAVEEDARLVTQAHAILDAQAVADVQLVCGPLCDGVPANAPYDLLFLDGAVAYFPPQLVGQVREGGRVVGATLDQSGVTHGVSGVRVADAFSVQTFAEIAAPPLPGFSHDAVFSF